MSDGNNKDHGKIYFEASTIETIDQSVYDFVNNLQLKTKTNEGSSQVPVLWGTSERAFLVKKGKESRDKQGALKFPAIAVSRTGISKSPPGSGIFHGNVPGNSDEKGGSIEISRVLNQEKTAAFAAADAKRKHKQEYFPSDNKKIVYQTVSIPMPVNVDVTYQILIRTEFQQQMNELMIPFITIPGTVRAVPLTAEGHRYEGFIQTDITANNNISSFSDEERRFEATINLKVVGYLVGHGHNQEKPHYTVRENAVEVKIPKERVIFDKKELEKYGL